jgi:hypothetical protein
VNGTAFGVRATRLLNGDVLLGGYYWGPDAAVYNAMSGNVQGLSFPDLVHVYGYTETLLTDGKVLLTGGLTNWRFGYFNNSYLYDPKNQSFQTTGPLMVPRHCHF